MNYSTHRAHHWRDVLLTGWIVSFFGLYVFLVWDDPNTDGVLRVILALLLAANAAIFTAEVYRLRRCATPLDAMDEIVCPSCEARIRARLADYPDSAK